jgi:hypothetical protein
MIVTATDGQLLLIRQMDHQVLAGVLAEAWGNDRFARPEPFGPLVRAAHKHDNGWHDWELAPKVDPATRQPYQFTDVPVQEHLTFYRRAIDELAARDPEAGLLVNLHCQGFHNQRFGTMPEAVMRAHPPEQEAAVKRFMIGLQSQQRELGRRVQVDTPALWAQYELLQFFDRLSLYLCMPPPTPTQIGPVPVAAGGDLLTLRLSPSGQDVHVDPWPFEGPSLDVWVVARRVPDRAYTGDAEFREELARAEPLAVEHTLRAT